VVHLGRVRHPAVTGSLPDPPFGIVMFVGGMVAGAGSLALDVLMRRRVRADEARRTEAPAAAPPRNGWVGRSEDA